MTGSRCCACSPREGAGADVVSEGELRRAREAGIPADRIVFSGVGKSPRELRLALAEDIAQINVESAEELDMLSALAAAMGRTARIALRINPDVDAGTHAKITTGRAQDKFGIPYADAIGLYRRAASLPGIEPVGLAVHIGSQILSLAPYRAAFGRLAELVRTLHAAGHTVTVVDCGGGLGIPYCNEPSPSPAALAGAIRGALHDLDVRVVIEPGRWLVGPAGVLLASVVLVKQTQGSRFVVLDAAMNDLVRPAMYDAWHGIVPVSAVDAVAPTTPADVVGPVCEIGRHLRAEPSVAAARSRCARGNPGRRRLWFGDEFGIQRKAGGGGGDGRRRALVGDPRPPDPRRLVARRTRARLAGMNETGMQDSR